MRIQRFVSFLSVLRMNAICFRNFSIYFRLKLTLKCTRFTEKHKNKYINTLKKNIPSIFPKQIFNFKGGLIDNKIISIIYFVITLPCFHYDMVMTLSICVSRFKVHCQLQSCAVFSSLSTLESDIIFGTLHALYSSFVLTTV